MDIIKKLNEIDNKFSIFKNAYFLKNVVSVSFSTQNNIISYDILVNEEKVKSKKSIDVTIELTAIENIDLNTKDVIAIIVENEMLDRKIYYAFTNFMVTEIRVNAYSNIYNDNITIIGVCDEVKISY